MIDVSEETKTEWAKDSSYKEIKILILGEGIIGNESIVQNSFSISENIMASDNFEFVGCNAKKLEFVSNGYNRPVLKNKLIYATIKAGNTDDINIFAGYVDSGVKQGNNGLKKIIAYDYFYRLSNMDATEWWNNLGEMTILEALQSFSRQYSFGIAQDIELINGNEICFGGTKRRVKRLSALDFLKQVCQINGGFGYFDGIGVFNIKYPMPVPHTMIYPANSLFPSNEIYPSNYESSGAVETNIGYYRDLEYEDYSVQSIGQITLRNTSKDEGYTFKRSGKNHYIIQGNIFAYDQDEFALKRIAEKIYLKVSGISYRPFTANHNAYPWLECGDNVSYWDIDGAGREKKVSLLIMGRQLSGDQNMWDTFSASGEEEQSIFITDLQAQIDDLKEQMEE